MSKITVMLPVFNGEAYLQRCLDSICMQTFRDFELLAVDDGSKDRSGAILDQFAEADARVRVIHQANGGISRARNAAVANARGEWLTFVDADDWLEPTYLSYLLELRDGLGVSMVACNHWIETPKGAVPRFPVKQGPRRLPLDEADENVLYNRPPDVSPWAKLYHRSLFDAVKYPDGKLFEDTYAIADLLKAAGGIGMGFHPKYHYRYVEGSISKTVCREHLWDFMDAVDHMTQAMLSRDQSLGKACTCRSVHAALSTKRLRVADDREPDMSRANKQIRAGLLETLVNPNVEGRNKLGALASLLGGRAYRSIWKLYAKARRKY